MNRSIYIFLTSMLFATEPTTTVLTDQDINSMISNDKAALCELRDMLVPCDIGYLILSKLCITIRYQDLNSRYERQTTLLYPTGYTICVTLGMYYATFCTLVYTLDKYQDEELDHNACSNISRMTHQLYTMSLLLPKNPEYTLDSIEHCQPIIQRAYNAFKSINNIDDILERTIEISSKYIHEDKVRQDYDIDPLRYTVLPATEDMDTLGIHAISRETATLQTIKHIMQQTPERTFNVLDHLKLENPASVIHGMSDSVEVGIILGTALKDKYPDIIPDIAPAAQALLTSIQEAQDMEVESDHSIPDDEQEASSSDSDDDTGSTEEPDLHIV